MASRSAADFLKRWVKKMTRIGILLAVIALLFGCTENRFPDPYAGFEYIGHEQGYWKEVTTDDEKIGELHMHSKGISITYIPFETYKDYWGEYALTKGGDRIHIEIAGGNELPGFEEASGTLKNRSDEIRITGIRLDSRRPEKMDFRFERFRTENTQQDVTPNR